MCVCVCRVADFHLLPGKNLQPLHRVNEKGGAPRCVRNLRWCIQHPDGPRGSAREEGGRGWVHQDSQLTVKICGVLAANRHSAAVGLPENHLLVPAGTLGGR